MVQCYYRHDSGGIQSINSGLCANSASAGGFYSCCFNWQICLPNALCFNPNGVSGYTTAQCTDPTLQDSSCQKSCNDQHFDDVVYNSTTKIWACCGGNVTSGATCSSPSNETFSAPAPAVLLGQTMPILQFVPSTTLTKSQTFTTSTIAAVSTSGSGTTMTSSPPGATSTPTPTSSAAATMDDGHSVSSHLSAGAGVGIGIGATLFLMAAVLAFWILFRRARGQKSGPRRRVVELPEDTVGKEEPQSPFSELHSKSRAYELPMDCRLPELDWEKKHHMDDHPAIPSIVITSGTS